MQDLKVTVIQSELVWENASENIANFDKRIDSITEPTDLIILPEMFNTGFSINPKKCAEDKNGETVKWLEEKARSMNCVITGSVLINDGRKFYNRLFWMPPDGKSMTYDKRHLFRMSEEYKIFSQGMDKIICSLKGWKILPLICYDLRFPVWSKNSIINGSYEYDIILTVANWPEVRTSVWKSLLVARAIDNQVYSIGVNRIGNDGHGTSHSGDSMIVDPKGQILYSLEPHKEMILSFTLSFNDLASFRKKFPVGLDWDHFNIIKSRV
ncbi:amidohydrolase [candidate division KSB1 bacterium]